MIDYALLKKLCTAAGISGDEGSVRDIIINEIKEYANELRVDNLGNLLVHKKGRAPAVNKLMLSAHMDEVGLLVTDFTADGYLKIDEVGGIDRRVLVGKRVYVGNRLFRLCRKIPHLPLQHAPFLTSLLLGQETFETKTVAGQSARHQRRNKCRSTW